RVAGFCTAQVLSADVAGDRPYIITEYVPGPSLQDLVHQQGPRTGTDLYRLAIGTVTALTAIHQAGIVHRDFKPPTVLIAPDGPPSQGAPRPTAGRPGSVAPPAHRAPPPGCAHRPTAGEARGRCPAGRPSPARPAPAAHRPGTGTHRAGIHQPRTGIHQPRTG